MSGIRRFGLVGILLISASGCWTGRGRAESLSDEIETGMSADDVLSRLGPPESRGPFGPHRTAPEKDDGSECWTYVTRTSDCWKAGWYASFFSVALTVPALLCFSGIWTEQWTLEVLFDKDHRVIRKVVWTGPQF